MTLRVRVVDQPWRAHSFSFFAAQRIYLGRGYDTLPAFARRAVIAHECAHLRGHHTEWRIAACLALLPVFPLIPFVLRRLCHWQEYRADERAAAFGHLHGMLYLLKSDCEPSLTHPKNMDRRNKLLHSPGCKPA